MFERARAKCKAIRERAYDPHETPRAVFTRQVSSCASVDRLLLELGCGRKVRLLKAVGKKYRLALGLDYELPRELSSDGSWAVIKATAQRIPLEPQSVDVIASIHVFEHLADPGAVFAECHRVLRPGGRLVLFTVNKWFPPIALARILPNRLRTTLNRLVSTTPQHETFPAYYRANAATPLRKMALRAGFTVQQLGYVSDHPHYFTFSVGLYRLAILLERSMQKHTTLSRFQNFIFGTFIRD